MQILCDLSMIPLVILNQVMGCIRPPGQPLPRPGVDSGVGNQDSYFGNRNRKTEERGWENIDKEDII